MKQIRRTLLVFLAAFLLTGLFTPLFAKAATIEGNGSDTVQVGKKVFVIRDYDAGYRLKRIFVGNNREKTLDSWTEGSTGELIFANDKLLYYQRGKSIYTCTVKGKNVALYISDATLLGLYKKYIFFQKGTGNVYCAPVSNPARTKTIISVSGGNTEFRHFTYSGSKLIVTGDYNSIYYINMAKRKASFMAEDDSVTHGTVRNGYLYKNVLYYSIGSLNGTGLVPFDTSLRCIPVGGSNITTLDTDLGGGHSYIGSSMLFSYGFKGNIYYVNSEGGTSCYNASAKTKKTVSDTYFYEAAGKYAYTYDIKNNIVMIYRRGLKKNKGNDKRIAKFDPKTECDFAFMHNVKRVGSCLYMDLNLRGNDINWRGTDKGKIHVKMTLKGKNIKLF